MRREIADRLRIVSRARPPDPAHPRQEFDALRHGAEATGRADTDQSEIVHVGQSLETLKTEAQSPLLDFFACFPATFRAT
jgi:hypothetical protein